MFQNSDYIDGKKVEEIMTFQLRRVKSPGQIRIGRFDPAVGRIYLTDDQGNLTGQIADIPGYKPPVIEAPPAPVETPQTSPLAYSDEESASIKNDANPIDTAISEEINTALAPAESQDIFKRRAGLFAIGAVLAAVVVYCIAMFVPGMQPIPW